MWDLLLLLFSFFCRWRCRSQIEKKEMRILFSFVVFDDGVVFTCTHTQHTLHMRERTQNNPFDLSAAFVWMERRQKTENKNTNIVCIYYDSVWAPTTTKTKRENNNIARAMNLPDWNLLFWFFFGIFLISIRAPSVMFNAIFFYDDEMDAEQNASDGRRGCGGDVDGEHTLKSSEHGPFARMRCA